MSSALSHLYPGNGGSYFYDRTAINLPAYPVHEIVTPPSSPDDLAISVADVKTHLSYPSEDTSVDTELEGFIRAAMASVESYCQITLLETVLRADYPWLDTHTTLRQRPYASFGKVEYVDPSDGEITTVDATHYTVTAARQMQATVTLGRGFEYEDAATRADAYRLTYTAGWTPATLPADLQNALLQIVAKLDQSRGDCDGGGAGGVSVYAMKNANGTPFPPAVAALLDRYRLVEMYFT